MMDKQIKAHQKKPEWVEEEEAKRWREVEDENKVVSDKYQKYLKDVANGMKRDNVWTNGTKDRIPNDKKAEKGTKTEGEYTEAEDWTRNMPTHIPDDIKGPTTSRTAAPSIDGTNKEYKFENTTKSGPSASDIAEESAPKKAASKEETTKATAVAGVDIEASRKASEEAKKQAKADEAAVKEQAAKAKAEADAEAKAKAEKAE